MVNGQTPDGTGLIPLQRVSASACPLGCLCEAGEPACAGGSPGGKPTDAGVEADRTDAKAGSRAGRELTMCPVGRTPLIPLHWNQ